MVRYILIALLLVGLIAGTALAVDATAAWNNHAATYHFDSYPTVSAQTFEQAYNGSDFEHDFNAILDAVATDLNRTFPPIQGDDELNFALENWTD